MTLRHIGDFGSKMQYTRRMTNSKNFPKGNHSGHIIVECDGQWIQVVRHVLVDDGGVWTWSGYFRNATARHIEVGDVFTNMFTNGGNRITATVVKINQRTFKVTDDEGNIHVIVNPDRR